MVLGGRRMIYFSISNLRGFAHEYLVAFGLVQAAARHNEGRRMTSSSDAQST
jgi:hypothetical protein